jgi:Cys-rich repeat protein
VQADDAGDASLTPGDAAPFDATGSEAEAQAVTDADAGPYCTTPLDPDAGNITLADIPLADWCEATRGAISEWTCQGVTAFDFEIGTDCEREFLFDAASGRLVAIREGCIAPIVCSSGDPDFQPPTECLSGIVPLNRTNPCAEADLGDATPDGAGSNCTSDSQCPTGFVCGYFSNNACSAIGSCVFGDFSHNPTCDPTTLCACDGTVTRACLSFVGGYALKPVPTGGQMPTCSGGD